MNDEFVGPSGTVNRLRMTARKIFVIPIRVYQLCLSPYFGTCCRFTPTCSSYAIEAIMTHGIVKGALLACWRLLRCNPWVDGGYDPVPQCHVARSSQAVFDIHHSK